MIKPLQKKHIEGIHRAFDTVARERRYFATAEAISFDLFKKWLDANVRHNCPQFVAVSQQGVVGWSIAHQSGEAFMQHSCMLFIGVLPNWRGRGIGRQLLNLTLDKAWRNGLSRIELDVYADNHKALALYRQAGFVVEGFRRHAHIVDGRYRDVVNMAVFAPVAESSMPCEEAAMA